MKKHVSSGDKEIALIICTRNNDQKLQRTLSEIDRLDCHGLQLVVVDQSPALVKYKLPRSIRSRLVLAPTEIGLSKARNKAMSATKSPILAWIDDDCLVTQSYIDELKKLPRKMNSLQQQRIAGIFGKTAPYVPTKPGDFYYCPCVFSKTSTKEIRHVCAHWKHIGLGNNMVLFRYAMNDLGPFAEWLGVGSVGQSAEDAEYMLRALQHTYGFLYNPKQQLYHNKWLDGYAQKRQSRMYNTGGIAAYGFYAFQGSKQCQQELMSEVSSFFDDIRYTFVQMRYDPLRLLFYIKHIFLSTAGVCTGFALAMYYARKMQKIR